jgi:hypothetical protein
MQTHIITIYLIDSPIILAFLGFVALFVLFKFAVWMINALPFL